MKKFFSFILYMLATCFISEGQNCMAGYFYSKNHHFVHFNNQSNLINAHYYWNFGDGTSSNFKDPIHEFPENGDYLVTLYALDTISKCSDAYEEWIRIIKNSNDICSPILKDSIYFIGSQGYLKLIDSSDNCNMYSIKYSALGGQSGNDWNTYLLTDSEGNGVPKNCISSIRFFDNNWELKRAAHKTFPYQYNKQKNYNYCSANFEFKVVSQDSTGQKLLFSAMNKAASGYTFYVTGFGDPITFYTDTFSFYFEDPYYLHTSFLRPPFTVILSTLDTGGCVERLVQHICLRSNSITVAGVKTNNIGEVQTNLYPIPFSDELHIDFTNSEAIKNGRLVITNALGQTLGEYNIQDMKNSFKLSHLPAGLYFAEISIGNRKLMRKKIIKP